MGNINTMKSFFLISGILNGIAFISWGGYTIISGLVICGLGCIFGILPAISLIASIMDFIAFSKVNSLNKTGTYGSAKFAAIFDIVTILTGNIISMVFGIMCLSYLNDPQMKEYMQQRGIY